MKKQIRLNNRKAKKIILKPATPAERLELDKNVIDLVLRALFENSDKTLDLQKDVLERARIIIPKRETQRIWDVLISSGWVSPTIGFGKSGKLELTTAGFQMMSQFGGYQQYLASIQNHQPQTIILPIQVDGEANADADAEIIPKEVD